MIAERARRGCDGIITHRVPRAEVDGRLDLVAPGREVL